MERRGLDLSRQSLASLAHIPRDVVREAERDAEPYALSLAQNRLAQLDDLYVFAHVVQLDLSSNQLSCLDGIEALPHLESLNAARNSLTSIDALVGLPQLRVLNVAENKLAQIDALRRLKSLVAVDASYNSITTWPQLSQSTKMESIDLSCNQLEAFPISLAVRLFPSSLRRLSLAKNQIQELCGIAALGMFLQNLETIKVESNPATQRVLRDGGCLDFLWVNLFASVTFAKGAGVRRDDFVVPREVVDAVEDAVERGDEAVLTQFLLTGTSSPPPVYSGPPFAAPPTRITRHDGDQGRLHEITRPPLVQETTVAPVASAADGLSKESKMEMWKRILDERKAQEQRDKAPATTRDVDVAPPPAPIPLAEATVFLKPEAKTRTVTIPSPSPTKIPPPRREPSAPTVSVPSQSVDALATQVKTLSDQLSGMRKYVNVWIKREQLTRVTAVKRIQKCVRHCLWRRHLQRLVLRRRTWRQQEYGVEPCSSPTTFPLATSPAHERRLHWYAVVIQRHVRGWLMRDRVSRWMYYSDAASKIQREWKRRRSAWISVKRELGLTIKRTTSAALVNAMTTLAHDVRQLQRVFVVQEHVLARQWRELNHYKRITETPAVVRVQRLWRGYAVRRHLGLPTRSRRGRMIQKQKTEARDAEMVALRTGLEALKQVVQGLVDKT